MRRVKDVKKKFTAEQIACALRQVEMGMSVSELIRQLGITDQTYYTWRKNYGGPGVSRLALLRQIERENQKLKQMVVNLSLDKHRLQEALAKRL